MTEGALLLMTRSLPYDTILVMADYYLELGNKIRELREHNGLTQEEFARLLGNYSASAISYFEKGSRHPKAEEISKIAEIFQVNIEELLPKTEDISSEAIKFRKEKEGHKKLDYDQLFKDIKQKKGLKPIKGNL
jgi:transcriptional regulator with XRE-family HTH domain